MKSYSIVVDGRPYMGENPNETYQGGEAWSNNSFQTSRQEINVLHFGDINDLPKVITGNRGLRSELDRIIRRVDDGWISFRSLEILVVYDTEVE